MEVDFPLLAVFVIGTISPLLTKLFNDVYFAFRPLDNEEQKRALKQLWAVAVSGFLTLLLVGIHTNISGETNFWGGVATFLGVLMTNQGMYQLAWKKVFERKELKDSDLE